MFDHLTDEELHSQLADLAAQRNDLPGLNSQQEHVRALIIQELNTRQSGQPRKTREQVAEEFRALRREHEGDSSCS